MQIEKRGQHCCTEDKKTMPEGTTKNATELDENVCSTCAGREYQIK
jgi:hypothetical protein